MEPDEFSQLKLESCRAYARMMNTLDFKHLEPWLADDLVYTSQWVVDEMKGKAVFADYIRKKLAVIRKAGTRVWAEIGYSDESDAHPCVLLAQENANELKSVLVVSMKGEKIKNMTLCCVPSPQSCRRTHERPV